MKNFPIFVNIFLIVFFISFPAPGQPISGKQKISDDLFIQSIEDSVYLVTHYFPWDANCLLVILPEKQGVLIDTPNETSGARNLLQWIHQQYGEISLTVINTGFHVDNLGGNEFFISKHIPVIGSDRTRQLVLQRGKAHKQLMLQWTSDAKHHRYHQGYRAVHFVPPTRTFNLFKGITITRGGESFEIFFPGESHTTDNVVVYLKNRKILFGGCMISALNRQKPGYTGDANMEAWPVSVQKVMEKFPQCKTVIPGHGKWGDRKLLIHTLKVLQTVENP